MSYTSETHLDWFKAENTLGKPTIPLSLIVYSKTFINVYLPLVVKCLYFTFKTGVKILECVHVVGQ